MDLDRSEIVERSSNAQGISIAHGVIRRIKVVYYALRTCCGQAPARLTSLGSIMLGWCLPHWSVAPEHFGLKGLYAVDGDACLCATQGCSGYPIYMAVCVAENWTYEDAGTYISHACTYIMSHPIYKPGLIGMGPPRVSSGRERESYTRRPWVVHPREVMGRECEDCTGPLTIPCSRVVVDCSNSEQPVSPTKQAAKQPWFTAA
jgi:hypothetical protein